MVNKASIHYPIIYSIPICGEEKYTWDKGEPYLELTGRDYEGFVDWWPRLWSCEEGDVLAGHTYMFRGLKDTAERVWDEQKWQYVPRPTQSQTV